MEKVSSMECSETLERYSRKTFSQESNLNFFTCMALSKAGLVVGPLRPLIRLLVCPSILTKRPLLGT